MRKLWIFPVLHISDMKVKGKRKEEKNKKKEKLIPKHSHQYHIILRVAHTPIIWQHSAVSLRQVALEFMPAFTKRRSPPRHLCTPHGVLRVLGISTWLFDYLLGRTRSGVKSRGGLSSLSFVVPTGSGLDAGFTGVDMASQGEACSRSIGVDAGHVRLMRSVGWL
jgi:hypothetical protein